ncbi:MAG: hypothetical protein BWY52_01347 [Chloroflexi bacterium ADurb.Bin325]|nr:MAG: hypothetical protein BWY52_01347 [Chloroflexi bacterium ADurb.Bin325]
MDVRSGRLHALRGEGAVEPPAAAVRLEQAAREWAIIFVAALIFCLPFLNLGSDRPLAGGGAEAVRSLDWALVGSLREHAAFPLWNPYLQTGLPFVADPALHAYNPLAAGSVLLFGAEDGFKVALFLSFLAAGYGAWLLGLVFGLRPVGRVWLALMYAFTGQAAARFLQGEYGLVLGLAWIPWALAAAIGAVRAGRGYRAYGWAALAAVALALLFFSGDIDYACGAAAALALLAAVAGIGVRREAGSQKLEAGSQKLEAGSQKLEAGNSKLEAEDGAPAQDAPVNDARGRLRVVFYPARLRVLAFIAVFALGLAAIRLLPLAEFWPAQAGQVGPQPAGSHTIGQILAAYLSRDPWRPDAAALSAGEFYAYIGVWPFLLLLPLPWVVRRLRRERRTLWPLVFLGGLALLAFVSSSVGARPWAGLHPAYMLVFGALGLLALAGLGLDAAAFAAERVQRGPLRLSVPGIVRWLAERSGGVLLAVFVVLSVGDVYAANRQYLAALAPYPAEREAARWLAAHAPGVYYTGSPNGQYAALVASGLRAIDAGHGLAFRPSLKDAANARQVQARPNYQILDNGLAPEYPDPIALQQFATQTVWELPHSLPYAFVASRAALNDVAAGRELWREDVVPVGPGTGAPNRIALAVDSAAAADADSLLVILTSGLKGWQLAVDGRSAALLNVGGYLAAAVQPGGHVYTFSYSPTSFWVGLAISLVSALALIVLAVTVVLRARRAAGQVVRTAATYTEGVLWPSDLLPLEDGAAVRLTVEPLPRASDRALADANARGERLAKVLFVLALGVYLFTRLYAIDRFPIYFFADEAVHSVLAEDLIEHGFKDAQGRMFPLYFEAAGNRWTPLLSVYVHAVSVALAGKSIAVNRTTSALVSLLAAASVALILGRVFRLRYWWTGVLLLALAPAWFLHSRTGFETVMMASFFAAFLLCYLLYRTRSPRYLFPAVLFGAATFYTYSNGQMIMVAAGVLLLLSDLPYHVRQWRTVLLAALLIAVLAVPLLRFRATQPESMTTHLRAINSYWFEAAPLNEKLSRFVDTYTYGLSPAYWFTPNEHDLVRHRMKGYGNLALPFLPFFLIGVGVCIWRIRSAAHRAVLMAVLASPAGAALVDVSITRVLVFIVPAVVLTGLGLEAALAWGTRLVRGAPSTGPASNARLGRTPAQDAPSAAPTLNARLGRIFAKKIPVVGLASNGGAGRASGQAGSTVVALTLFLVLSAASVWMLRDALVNGPRWYNDYGLYGMQWGAKQLFTEAIPEALAQNPNSRIMLTSTWANGADTFLRFFLPAEQRARVQMLNVDYYMGERRALDDNVILVMTPAEYRQAADSPKFARVDVDRVIDYPDGSPGFYFARLEYSPDFDELLAPEREARVRPVPGQVVVDGQLVEVMHSPLDVGRLEDLFDGETFTLVRGLAANPLVFDFTFPAPRAINGLAADFGSMDFRLTVRLYADAAGEPVVYTEEYRGQPPDPHITMTFPDAPSQVVRVRIEIEQLNPPVDVHIHVREFRFE